jgi:hypothetical protein
MLRNVTKWKIHKRTCIYQVKSFWTNSVFKSKDVPSIDLPKLNSNQKKTVEFYIQNELPDKDLEKEVKELKLEIIKRVIIKRFIQLSATFILYYID